MKRTNIYFGVLIVGLLLVFSSCSKEETWDKNRDNLIGEWRGEASFVDTYSDGEVKSGFRDVGIEFISDEAAILKNNSFLNLAIDWVYQPNPERIAIVYDLGFPIPKLFEIIENNDGSQVWETNYIRFEFDTVTMTSIKVEVFEKWNLTRK